jgi:hypothetical protein
MTAATALQATTRAMATATPRPDRPAGTCAFRCSRRTRRGNKNGAGSRVDQRQGRQPHDAGGPEVGQVRLPGSDSTLCLFRYSSLTLL